MLLMRLLPAALVALAMTLPAVAQIDAERGEFATLVAVCDGAADGKAEDACLGRLLERKRAALSDVLVRTSGMVGQRTTGMLAKAQRDWEAYVKSTCAFHDASLGNRDLRRGRFCEMRLINQRYDEIVAGADFADPVGRTP